MAEENQNMEETITQTPSCSKSKCCCGKLLCLKGLASIYKVLSILVLVIMLGMLGWAWYTIITAGAGIMDGLLTSLQIIIYYGFISLFLITISRVLKTLRKIKHAVEHK
jgi:hypothetical protein